MSNTVRNRVFCIPHLHSTPPLWGFPSEYRHPVWYGKTRMVWLPDGEKISKMCLFVLKWPTNVTDKTDRQTDGQTLHADIGRAYASNRAAKNRMGFRGSCKLNTRKVWKIGVFRPISRFCSNMVQETTTVTMEAEELVCDPFSVALSDPVT